MEAEGSEFPAFEFNIVTSRTGGKGLRSRENSSVGMLSGFFGQLLNSSGIVFRNYTRGIRMNRVPSADIHLTWQLRSQGIWRSVRCIAESVRNFRNFNPTRVIITDSATESSVARKYV